ncbi:MAG TPA: hypothetical protein VMR89_01270 [Actinomycetota bacterium]|nr:hypothetical protein [Actinomycetota bacterium]
MRRLLFTALIGAAPLLMATPAAAHTQTVTPPGQDPVVSRPIARPWIQGHCQAAAPMVTFEASGGVVDFFPHGELACDPTITNPGGQSTGP